MSDSETPTTDRRSVLRKLSTAAVGTTAIAAVGAGSASAYYMEFREGDCVEVGPYGGARFGKCDGGMIEWVDGGKRGEVTDVCKTYDRFELEYEIQYEIEFDDPFQADGWMTQDDLDPC